MIAQFDLLDLPVTASTPLFTQKGIFHLHTCQRQLFLGKNLGSKSLQGQVAYHRLLEIICGLRSKLIAENEIVAQFKKAYKNYLEQDDRDSSLVRLLEKLFQDAKKIRADYLTKIGQCSYAGLSKKILTQNSANNRVLILGSGTMACDLIKVLKKRFQIFISARNDEAVAMICKEQGIKSIPWGNHQDYFLFSNIINTIGANKVFFKHHFFLHWSPQKRIFIDISTPGGLETTLNSNDGIYTLEDLFHKGNELTKTQNQQIEKSKQAIALIANKRHQYFLKERSLEQRL